MSVLEIEVPTPGTKAWKWKQQTFHFREGLTERLSAFMNEDSAKSVANDLFRFWCEHFQYDPLYAFNPERDEEYVK